MKKLILTLIINCFLISIFCQVQIGDPINGVTEGDFLGYFVSLSLNGERAAISSRSVSENLWRVQIYEEQNDIWMKVGAPIEAEAIGDNTPPSISLSLDGKSIAMGYIGSTEMGQVSIYKELDNSWIQVGDHFTGYAFALSPDGKRISIGDPLYKIDGEMLGSVSVYEEDDGNWIQIGMNIEGEDPEGLFGLSVALSSNGKRLATVAPYGEPYGYVSVYEETNGIWTQIAMDISGDDADYRVGGLVFLSTDGTRVVSSEADFGTGLGNRIKIFEENNGNWTQIGENLEGDIQYDWFGLTFSMSADGTRVAISDPGTLFEPIERGYVRIYEENNGTWTQIGEDIEGEIIGDYFGWSSSLSSDKTRVAVGTPYVNSNGNASGQVKIFELPLNTSISETNLKSEMRLKASPNPSYESFFIEFETDVGSLIVSDVNGKIIKSILVNGETNHTLSLTGVDNGMYFIHAKSKHSTLVQRIVKL